MAPGAAADTRNGASERVRAAAWNMVAVPITFSRRRPWRARWQSIMAPPNITPTPKPIRVSRGPRRAPIAPIIFTSPPPIPPIAKGQRRTPIATPRPARLSSRPVVPMKAVLSVIPRTMAVTEIAFGIRRIRTSLITHSATKTTTVANMREGISSLHLSVQIRPGMRGAVLRPPFSRFHPDNSSGLESGRGGAVDHDLSLAPKRADILGDHDRRRGGDGADHRQGDAVLGQILARIIHEQPRHQCCHASSFPGSPPR